MTAILMRYRLRTLMILLALVPPVLAWFWIIGREIVPESFRYLNVHILTALPVSPGPEHAVWAGVMLYVGAWISLLSVWSWAHRNGH